MTLRVGNVLLAAIVGIDVCRMRQSARNIRVPRCVCVKFTEMNVVTSSTAAAATKTVNTLTANTLLAQKRGERAEDMMVATEVGLADFVRSSREAERRWISNSFSLVAATRLWCFVCLVGEDRSVDYGLWTSFMASVDQELLEYYY